MTMITVDKMTSVFREYNIRKAALFGSAARNETTDESDVDIVVSFAGQYDLLDMVGLKQELEDMLHLPVDVMTYESLKNNAFAHAVLADEKVIYEQS
jgi:predicted nucleotidyltransferase